MRPAIRALLGGVQKPYRLIGGEAGSLAKPWGAAQVRICLAFPDVYEIGMSHLGLAILYDIINARSDSLAERVYAPWGDVERELSARHIPLFSLESRHELCAFDVIGVTLPYELTYTNILAILDLGRIPLKSDERTAGDPLVIAGGPAAFNPEPVAPFFDAIVIGDGEEAIVAIIEAVKEYKSSRSRRDEVLKHLSTVRGIYVPSLFRRRGAPDTPPPILRRGGVRSQSAPAECEARGFSCAPVECEARGFSCAPAVEGIRKATLPDLDAVRFPTQPVIAHAAVQDRAAIEIQRGCTRGCRFCQAGMIYRPVRQRSPQTVCALARDQLRHGGQAQLSLLSLSVGDYACLDEVLERIGGETEHTDISLPSLRTESLTQTVLKRLGRDRSGSFTLAPEAATERMRAFINKGNTDENLYESVERVFQNGWSKIKLYFMVGLPGETREEIDGIVRLSNRCLDIGRRLHRRPEITVSTSTFVPKPHTPLQWASQISVEKTLEIQRYLKKNLNRPGLYYRWHDAEMSFLEGVFSRGGRELADVVEQAYANGTRFDGWDDAIDKEAWRAAFDHCGIDPQSYLAARGHDEHFAWDHLYAELSRDFLWREYERAQRGEATETCADGRCQGCGVCDFSAIRNRTYDVCRSEEAKRPKNPLPSLFMCSQSPVLSCSGPPDRTIARENESTRVRIRFSKIGCAALIGHLELMEAVRRALRRADLPLAYTEGYHPRPKISVGRALPVGVESVCEFVDVTLTKDIGEDEVMTRLGRAGVEGLAFTEVRRIDRDAPSLDRHIVASRYEVELPTGTDIERCARSFRERETMMIELERKGSLHAVELKSVITDLAVCGGSVVEVTLSHEGPSVKWGDVLKAIFGLTEEEAKASKIRKVDVSFRTN